MRVSWSWDEVVTQRVIARDEAEASRGDVALER